MKVKSLSAMLIEKTDKTSITERDWFDLYRRERMYIRVTVWYVPAVVLCLIGFSAWSGDVPNHFGLVAGGAGIVAFVLAELVRRRFACPRCHHAFVSPIAFHSNCCAHCGLERGATGRIDELSSTHELAHNAPRNRTP